MGTNQKLVILGAGIGGLSVIAELAESGVALDGLDITVVDEDFSHFLGFTLPWVMRGWRDQTSVPIRPTGQSLAGVTTVRGRVDSIDPIARQVDLADTTRLDFDALILATGARNAPERVPGLPAAMDAGVAVHYYSADAAADAHRALRDFGGGKLVFLVTSEPYRCPVAPYEGAMLAADLLQQTGARAKTAIAAYSPEAQPMPSAGPYAGRELVDLLHDNGIGFFGDSRVAGVDAEARKIEFDDGATVDFDLLVFVPPHQPAVTLDQPGWVGVDATTMATRHPGIFAIGDAASVPAPSGRLLPKAATFARNGAKTAAENALHYLGRTDQTSALSGEGYCYLDTGTHNSAQGRGDFFAVPHPAIHLSAPSGQQHDAKQQEERVWRALWERHDGPTGAVRSA